MTIKIISQSSGAAATPASTSLFRQPGQADAGDLFASLLSGLGDTLLTDPKTGLLGEDAALSPLLRKLKAAQAAEGSEEPQQTLSDLNAMLGAAALLPPASTQQAAKAAADASAIDESPTSTSQSDASSETTDPALFAAQAAASALSAHAVPSPGASRSAAASMPGQTTRATPEQLALASQQAGATGALGAVSRETRAGVDAGKGNAAGVAATQVSGQHETADPQTRAAEMLNARHATPADLAATGQKGRTDTVDFTQTLQDAAARSGADTAPQVTTDGRQIQIALPAAERGAPQQLVTIQTPVGQPQWSDDVGQQVVVMMNAKLETAQLQVNPPDLGPVEISLKMGNDGSAQLSFVAGVAETRQALEQGMPRLSAMLADNGIRLADAQVSSGQGQAFRDNGQFAQQGQQGGQGRPQGSDHAGAGSQTSAALADLPAGSIAVNMPLPSSEVSIYA